MPTHRSHDIKVYIVVWMCLKLRGHFDSCRHNLLQSHPCVTIRLLCMLVQLYGYGLGL